MKQLKRKHSEIRLSSFQLLIEIFERSHNFRIMVLEELQFILNQTLETNNTYLPPPKLAAKKLRTLSAGKLFLFWGFIFHFYMKYILFCNCQKRCICGN